MKASWSCCTSQLGGPEILSEYFIIVGGSKGKVSVNMMGSTSSDHATTFFCLDRVIFC